MQLKRRTARALVISFAAASSACSAIFGLDEHHGADDVTDAGDADVDAGDAVASADVQGVDSTSPDAADTSTAADTGSDAGGEPPGPPTIVSALVPYVVTTVAGSTAGFADGTGSAAKFFSPFGVALEGASTLFVSDHNNHRIRKVDAFTGVVTTLAGSGSAGATNANGLAASFYAPDGVAVGPGSKVYVADENNNRIRMITAAGDVTTLAGSGVPTFADGTGSAASFNAPTGVAVLGTDVFVADALNHRIRKVTTAGVVSTVAGSGAKAFADGQGAAASFATPFGIGADNANLYVVGQEEHRIRLVTPAGAVATVAGSGTAAFSDGTGAAASFNFPAAVAPGSSGAYIADSGNHRIRHVTAGGVVTTIAGSGVAGFADGVGALASFNSPIGLAVGLGDVIYVADADNHRIRQIRGESGWLDVTWNAPSKPGSSAVSSYTASASAPGQTTRTCTTTGLSLSCTVMGLQPSVTYSVRVVATNAAGAGASSSPTTATPK